MRYLFILLLFFFSPLTTYAAWTGVEDFESYTAGASISGGAGGSGWSANWVLSSGTANVENVPAGGMVGKALKFASGVAGNANRTLAGQATGEVSYEVQASVVTVATNIHSVSLYSGATNVIVCRLGVTTAGAFECYNGTTVAYESVGTMSANTRHTIKIKYGHVANKYAVSFGGGAYGADKGVNGTLNNADKFDIDNTASDARDFWVDNIKDGAAIASTPTSILSLVRAFFIW